MKLNEKDIYGDLTHYLYETYIKKMKKLKNYWNQTYGIPDIPIEILYK